MVIVMTNQTQDTQTQDPIDRFTLRIEEMRRDSVVRGPMKALQNLFLDFFVNLFRVLANLAEQRRNGTLPALPPPVEPDEARAWPPLRQRESGWAEYRSLYDPWGDSSVPAPVEQPAMLEPIEPLQAGALAARPLRPRVRVRTSRKKSEPALARSKREGGGCWALWRGPRLVLAADVGFLRLDLKKWVFGGLVKCVHFVAI